MNDKCLYCGSGTNLYGDCVIKCEKWFESISWLNFINQDNPFLELTQEQEE